MKKKPALNESQFLDLLRQVLPDATPDPRLADAIYERVAREIRRINHVRSLEQFCTEGSLPDLEPETVGQFTAQLEENFGAEKVRVTPSEAGDAVAIEVDLPDRVLQQRVRVMPEGSEPAEEVKAPMVPFPVALPEDPDLLWVLARREDLAPEEASRALAAIEEEFWETKAGLKLLKDRTERSFAEFIAHVPAAALADHGMKRHYKEPEPRQTLRRRTPGGAPG